MSKHCCLKAGGTLKQTKKNTKAIPFNKKEKKKKKKNDFGAQGDFRVRFNSLCKGAASPVGIKTRKQEHALYHY